MEKTKTIWTALAEFQSECPAIAKDSTAGQGNFKYKYGSLPMILEVIKPHMKKAGLVYTQPIVVGQTGVELIRTILAHTGGEDTIQSDIIIKDVQFKGMNEIQSKGSVITYLRRYALLSILGIVPEDDDDDAHGETSKTAQKSTQPPKATNPSTKPANVENSANKAEKPWLNPKDGGKENPSWLKAVKYLADGGTIDAIKKKYRIGTTNENKLKEQALTFNDLPFDRQRAEQIQDAEIVNETIDPDGPNTLFDQQGQPTEPPDDMPF